MTRSATVGGEARKWALPLAAVAWPPSWVSTTDNNDEDDEEVLVPQTPLTTRPSTLLLLLLSRSVMVGRGDVAVACAVLPV
jgi:hypothetical protein